MLTTRKTCDTSALAAVVVQMSTTTGTGTSPTRSSVSRFGSAATRVPRATASAAREDTRSVPQIRQPVAQHAREVLLRLGDGRDATRVLDGPGTGVVGGDRERQVAAVAVEQHAQVAAPTLDVVARQEDVHHLVLRGRLRHELHQSQRTLT